MCLSREVTGSCTERSHQANKHCAFFFMSRVGPSCTVLSFALTLGLWKRVRYSANPGNPIFHEIGRRFFLICSATRKNICHCPQTSLILNVFSLSFLRLFPMSLVFYQCPNSTEHVLPTYELRTVATTQFTFYTKLNCDITFYRYRLQELQGVIIMISELNIMS